MIHKNTCQGHAQPMNRLLHSPSALAAETGQTGPNGRRKHGVYPTYPALTEKGKSSDRDREAENDQGRPFKTTKVVLSQPRCLARSPTVEL